MPVIALLLVVLAIAGLVSRWAGLMWLFRLVFGRTCSTYKTEGVGSGGYHFRRGTVK